jgi:uncharacterized protein YjiS (DUF1127 family)
MKDPPENLMTLLRLVAAGPFPLTFRAGQTICELQQLADLDLVDLAILPLFPPSQSEGRRAVVLGLLPEGKRLLRS